MMLSTQICFDIINLESQAYLAGNEFQTIRIFWCARSLAAKTPLKYELNSNDITDNCGKTKHVADSEINMGSPTRGRFYILFYSHQDNVIKWIFFALLALC